MIARQQHYFFNDLIALHSNNLFYDCSFYKAQLPETTAAITFNKCDFYDTDFSQVNLEACQFSNCQFNLMLPGSFLKQLDNLANEDNQYSLTEIETFLTSNTLPADFIFHVLRADCPYVLQAAFNCGLTMQIREVVYTPIQFAFKFDSAKCLPVLFKHVNINDIYKTVEPETMDMFVPGEQLSAFLTLRNRHQRFLDARRRKGELSDDISNQFKAEKDNVYLVYQQQGVSTDAYLRGEAITIDFNKTAIDLAQNSENAEALATFFENYHVNFGAPSVFLTQLSLIAKNKKSLNLSVLLIAHQQASDGMVRTGINDLLEHYDWNAVVKTFLDFNRMPTFVGSTLLKAILLDHTKNGTEALSTFLLHPNCTKALIVYGGSDLLLRTLDDGLTEHFERIMASRHVYPELLCANERDRHSNNQENLLQKLFHYYGTDAHFDSLVNKVFKHPQFTASACGSLADWYAFFPDSFAGSAMERMVIKHSYRPKYESFFKAHSNVQEGVIALLNDYTNWLLKFHWRRHHVEEVTLLLQEIDVFPPLTNAQLLEKLEKFMKDLGPINEVGSLSRRMTYIQHKLSQDIPEPSSELSRL